LDLVVLMLDLLLSLLEAGEGSPYYRPVSGGPFLRL